MEKRRQPRALTLTLPHDQQPYLLLDGRKYMLRNFSAQGIGLWVPEDNQLEIEKGRTLEAEVILSGQIYPVKLEPVHITTRMVGLRIIHKSKELDAVFTKLLEPAHYAASMELHEKSGAEGPVEKYPRIWYVGDGGAELLVWMNTTMILSLQLIWAGKWVFRKQFEAPRTGFLKDDRAPHRGIPVKDSELLIAHDSADRELIEEACHFLSCVPVPLPGHLLWQFVETGEQVHLPPNVVPLKGTGT